MNGYLVGFSAMEILIVALPTYGGALLLRSGLRSRTLIGFLGKIIGAGLVIFAIYCQYAMLEMPYLLVGIALVLVPAVALVWVRFLKNETYETYHEPITASIIVMSVLATGAAVISFIVAECKVLEAENSPYVRVEVKAPVYYSLKELGGGKYLIANGYQYEYELLLNATEDSGQIVHQGEEIKILPLEDGKQPHLTVAETWQHERYPGIKLTDEVSYVRERTVTIYVAPDQTAIAYSESQ